MATDADKDRRSRMAISTVHAPPKKGGAGGHFTWGSATDTSMDFDASRVQQPVKVITGAPVVQQTAAAGTPFTANLASAQQFPSLGTRTVTAPMASSAWATRPPVVAAAGAVSQPVTAGAPQPVATIAPTTVVQPAVRPVVMQPAAATMGASTRTITTMTPQTIQAPAYPAGYQMAYAAPVAAPRVIKEVADKDRRSRMAYSTYHQEPKKGGAGGAYTWGTAGDVQDYDPTTVQAIESKVTTAPTPVSQTVAAASPFTGNISSAQQFPSLGSSQLQSSTQPSPWAAPPASIKEPPVMTGPTGTTPAGSPGLVPSPAPVASPPGPVPAADPAAPPLADSTEQKDGKNCSIQ